MRARRSHPTGGTRRALRTIRSRKRWGSGQSRRGLLGLSVVLGLAAWGCGDDGVATGSGGQELPELRVVAGEHSAAEVDGGVDYGFELPDQVPAGVARVSLENEGDELHHAQLFKLNDDATVEDVEAALANGGPAAVLEVGAFQGGTSLVAPGDAAGAEAVVELTDGTYVLLCLIENVEGVPHAARGMLSAFEITRGDDPPPAPEADVAVELADYGFHLPQSIPGDAVLEVTNTARTEPHEMTVVRLDAGASEDDVLDAVGQGPITDLGPATAVGGVQALLPGASQWLQLDLDPGNYVVLCVVPSPDGTRHVAKGMIQQIAVT